MKILKRSSQAKLFENKDAVFKCKCRVCKSVFELKLCEVSRAYITENRAGVDRQFFDIRCPECKYEHEYVYKRHLFSDWFE